eukprot:346746_1
MDWHSERECTLITCRCTWWSSYFEIQLPTQLMGTCLTPPDDIVNKDINERLLYDRRVRRYAHFLILCGTKGAGKTTILQGVLSGSYNKYLNSIRSDCVSSIIHLLTIMQDTDSIQLLQSLSIYNPHDLDRIRQTISIIWTKYNAFERILFHAYAYKNEFELLENMDYFMANIDRIMFDDMEEKQTSILNTEDIIRYHTKHNAMNRYSWTTNNDNDMEMIDVPTNCNGIWKHFHMFDEPRCYRANSAVVFVAALSDYCETITDVCGHTKNAMDHSLEYFNSIVNSRYFRNYEKILFLNKEDIFRKRIRKGVSLSMCFGIIWDGPDHPDYEYNEDMSLVISYWIKATEFATGRVMESDIAKIILQYLHKEQERVYAQALLRLDEKEEYFEECYNQSLAFITNSYQEQNTCPNQIVFTHVTVAIDEYTVQRVLWDCQNILIRSSLRRGGLMV